MAAGDDNHKLFAIDLIGHGVRKTAGGQFDIPEFVAVFQAKGPESIVGGCTDKYHTPSRYDPACKGRCTPMDGQGNGPSIASFASRRILKKRAAQSHLSRRILSSV